MKRKVYNSPQAPALWHDRGLLHGLAIATPSRSGFAGPNIFALVAQRENP
jgi:hypothetical protein